MRFFLSFTFLSSLLLTKVNTLRFPAEPGTMWNYVLGDDNFDVTKEKAPVIDVDYEQSAETIARYHKYGKKVICYFSGGTVEDWRNDFKDYKSAGILGNEYDDWPGEYWINYKKYKGALRTLIERRMRIAKSKNCDGIEVDNLDGYQVNRSHWDLTENDAIEFAKWLVSTAHSIGIPIGLKNVPGLLKKSRDLYAFDFAINESCVNHSNECAIYKDFIAQGKPVFGITYGNFNSKRSALCKALNGVGISMIVKESQNLRQAGRVFDGKKDCGSSFSNGSYSKSNPVTNKNTNVANGVKPSAPAKNAAAAAAATKVPVASAATKTVTGAKTTVVPGTPATKQVGAGAQPAKTENETSNAAEINDPNGKSNDKNGDSTVGTTLVLTGSAVSAAAVFVLLKKNPKQYEQIKRGISRGATSIKRSASSVSRKLTTKRTTPPTLPTTTVDPVNNINDNQYNTYRYHFTQNFEL